jgi:hypothetical protein
MSASPFVTILSNPDREIVGSAFVEAESPRSLPGIPSYRGATYLTTDVAASRTYKSDEEGWTSVPSARVMKRRARRERVRQERRGWLGTAQGSLQEPVETTPLPPL